MLVTGQADHEDTIRAINDGGLHHYISKPWKSENLVDIVRAQLTEFVLGSADIDPMPYVAILDGAAPARRRSAAARRWMMPTWREHSARSPSSAELGGEQDARATERGACRHAPLFGWNCRMPTPSGRPPRELPPPDDHRLRFLDGELELDVAVAVEAGAGRDQVTHDDVFLEAAQVVDLAERGGFGEHPGGVLEGRGGDERVGLQRGLGDAEQDRLAFGRLAALGDDLLVDAA